MKHRSIIAFILLAAALAAAPQVSHDLAALKSAVSARIRGEILHAFLSLHARDGAGEAAPRRAAPQLASCTSAPKSDAQQTPARARRGDDGAQAAPQRGAREQLAMLVVPSPESEESDAETPAVDDRFIHGKSAQLPGRVPSAGELAMLIPPDSAIDIPGRFIVRADDARQKRAATEQWKAAESSRGAASAAAHFEVALDSKFANEEAFRNLGPLVRDAVWVRAAEEGAKVRVFKFRRPARAVGAGPAAVAPKPAPAAALGKPLSPAPPASFQTSEDE
jgi:hypothetical protein